MTKISLTQLALEALEATLGVNQRNGCFSDNQGFITVKDFTNRLYLANIYTSGAARNTGVAQRRLERLCAIADKAGLNVLTVVEAFSMGADKPSKSNQDLRKWYKKFGFSSQGRAMSLERMAKPFAFPTLKEKPATKGELLKRNCQLFLVEHAEHEALTVINIGANRLEVLASTEVAQLERATPKDAANYLQDNRVVAAVRNLLI